MLKNRFSMSGDRERAPRTSGDVRR